jgi:hypothetical protein
MIRVFLAHSWRARRRALIVLALMVGLSGGAAFAAAAGARRSSTALDRFRDAAQTLDVFVAGDLSTSEPQAMRELLDGPLVESTNDLVFLMVNDEASGLVFAPTSRRGLQVERGVLLEGRRANPDEPGEVTLSERAANDFGIRVGGSLKLESLSKAQAQAFFEDFVPPKTLDGPKVNLRVVGIVRTGFDLNTQDDVGALTLTTPAFWEKYGDEIGVGSQSHMVRLEDTPSAIERFTDALERAYGDEHLPSVNVGQGEETVGDSISVATVALWAVAFVVAFAGIVWTGLAMGRHQRLVAPESETLRALGATQHERRVIVAASVLPGLVGGLALAPLVAVLLSPRFPVGAARRVDPSSGFHVDLVALFAGIVALAAVLAIIAIVSAVRLVARGQREVGVDAGVPTVVERTARWLRPAPAAGVRFALHAPARTAAPYRPALLGALVGVIGLVGVAVVGGNLQRLVDTPSRWGVPWDVAVRTGAFLDNPEEFIPEEGQRPLQPDRDELLENDDIEAAGALVHDDQITVNGVEAISMTFATVKGVMTPTVVAGREPRAGDEIALARDTLTDVDVDLGSTVTVRSRSNKSAKYRIVGVIAFPSIGEPSPVATGASFTAEGGDRLRLGFNDSDDTGASYVVIRWAPGIDHADALAELHVPEEVAGDATVFGVTAPPEVNGLSDVRRFPLFVAIALVLLGVIATSHALIVTVRRRRLEFGVLSALGFTPGQRRVVIAAQATTIAIIALVVGVPLGVIAGRVVWSAIASSMGVATDAMFPFLVLAIGALGFAVVLNLIAVFPARSARRLSAATALRSE